MVHPLIQIVLSYSYFQATASKDIKITNHFPQLQNLFKDHVWSNDLFTLTYTNDSFGKHFLT